MAYGSIIVRRVYDIWDLLVSFHNAYEILEFRGVILGCVFRILEWGIVIARRFLTAWHAEVFFYVVLMTLWILLCHFIVFMTLWNYTVLSHHVFFTFWNPDVFLAYWHAEVSFYVVSMKLVIFGVVFHLFLKLSNSAVPFYYLFL